MPFIKSSRHFSSQERPRFFGPSLQALPQSVASMLCWTRRRCGKFSPLFFWPYVVVRSVRSVRSSLVLSVFFPAGTLPSFIAEATKKVRLVLGFQTYLLIVSCKLAMCGEAAFSGRRRRLRLLRNSQPSIAGSRLCAE